MPIPVVRPLFVRWLRLPTGLPSARAPALCAALGTALALGLPTPATARGYAEQGRCGGFARVDVQAPPGHCVALVADERQGLRFPRRLVEVSPGRFWITDMGNWEPGRGRLIELKIDQSVTPPRVEVKVLADKLDRPHGLAIGPDGKAYVGEAGRVWRAAVTGPLVREDVLTGLPDEGAHPLKELAFGPLEGGARLFVGIGSETDACRDAEQRHPRPCPEVEGPTPRAAVYAAHLAGPTLALHSFKPWATGLRNSLGLVWLPQAQALLQAENSIDYPDAAEPPEELNRLREGDQYGWPYCVGARRPARGYAPSTDARTDCARSTPPIALWPARAAPQSLTVAPAGSPLAGSVFASFHGWRPSGHRVVRFEVDAQGRARGQPVDWLGGWTSRAGVRPAGAPAGLTFDHAGRLWVVEDRNRTLLMVWPEAARATPAHAASAASAPGESGTRPVAPLRP